MIKFKLNYNKNMKSDQNTIWNKLDQSIQDQLTDIYDSYQLRDALAEIYKRGYADACKPESSMTEYFDLLEKYDNLEADLSSLKTVIQNYYNYYTGFGAKTELTSHQMLNCILKNTPNYKTTKEDRHSRMYP